MDMIGCNAGALTAEEAAFLDAAKAPRPAHFTVLGPQPETRIVQVADLAVGLVFFPAPPNAREPVPAALSEAVAQAAAGLRGRTGLIIGISGWGMADEEAFQNAHPGTLDVLLGSGPNAGTAGRVSQNGKNPLVACLHQGKNHQPAGSDGPARRAGLRLET